jgi:hypothetical protein
MKNTELTTTQDINQLIKDRIFEAANNKELFIQYNGERHPAKLYGRLFNYPVIAATDELSDLLQTEINWYQAQRLSEGKINTILFN